MDYQKVEEYVRSSLIYGPVSKAEFEQAFGDPNGLKYLITELLRKSCERGMKDKKFDNWLRRVRQDHYIQLVKGGRKLTGEARNRRVFLQSSSIVGSCGWRTGSWRGLLRGADVRDRAGLFLT